MSSQNVGCMAKQFVDNPFACALLDKAAKLRIFNEDNSKNMSSEDQLAISKQYVRLVRTQSISQPSLQAYIEHGIDELASFTSVECAVFFELLGASLETCSVGDQVRYSRKFNQVYRTTGRIDFLMTVMPYSCAYRGQNKIQVYSEAQGDKIKVNKGEVQIVDPTSLNEALKIKLSKESELKLVSLIEAESTNKMTIMYIIKYFLKRFEAKSEADQDDSELQERVAKVMHDIKAKLSDLVSTAKS